MRSDDRAPALAVPIVERLVAARKALREASQAITGAAIDAGEIQRLCSTAPAPGHELEDEARQLHLGLRKMIGDLVDSEQRLDSRILEPGALGAKLRAAAADSAEEEGQPVGIRGA